MILKKLLVIISVLLLSGCVDVKLGQHEVCGYARGSAFCGIYDFDKVKFIGPIKDAPISKIEGGFIIIKESWLNGLRPKLKELLRERKDSKKKGKIYIDGFLSFRENYSI